MTIDNVASVADAAQLQLPSIVLAIVLILTLLTGRTTANEARESICTAWTILDPIWTHVR